GCIRLRFQGELAHGYERGHSFSDFRRCSCARSLDDDWRANSNWTSGTTTRHSDAFAPKTIGQMADRSVPEHQFTPGNAVPERSGDAACCRKADAVAPQRSEVPSWR